MSTLGVSPARMLRPLRWSVVVGALLLLACGQPSAPASTSAPPATPVTPVVASVTVSPATAVLAVGATVDLSAAGFDRNGTAVPGRTVSWNSATPAVATVSNAGRVTAVTAGTASIRATIDGQSATASITVTTVPGGSDGFVTAVPPIDFNVIPARPTETSIALSLYSASTRTVTVTLLDENRVVTQALTGGEPAVLELTGLAPERSYRYRITGPSLSFTGAFRTARRTGSAFRFVMQADSHLDTNTDPALYTNTLRNMVADSADFLVDLGDTFMSDKYADFRDAAAQYYAQRHYFGIVGTVMPTFLVQGNHDAENGWLGANTTWAAQQRVRWFPPIIGNAFYSTAFLPRNYCAWRWGDATFIALDPYTFTATQPNRAGSSWAWTLGREQYDWLERTLRGTTTPFTFVFLHHLVGGRGFEARGGVEASYAFEWGGANLDGTPGFTANRPGWTAPIHQLLVQYQVSAVFHGHDHLYVNQQRDGIRYQEVPQPGFPRDNATASAVDYGYLSGVLLGSFGHLRVSVASDRAVVEYVRSRLTTGNGAVVDRYEILPARRP